MDKLIVLRIFGMFAAPAVAPVVAADPPFYMGVSVGKVQSGQADAIGAAVHESQLAQWGLTQVSEGQRGRTQSEVALLPTIGTNLGRHAAVELTYFLMLEPARYGVSGRATTASGPQAGYLQFTDILVNGPALSVLGRWPVSGHWQLYGRAGMFRSEVKASGFLCGGISGECGGNRTDPITGLPDNGGALIGKGIDYEATATNPFFGVGVLFAGAAGGLRLEYTAYPTRNPREAKPDPLPSGHDMPKPPLENVARSGTMHFVSIGFYMD